MHQASNNTKKRSWCIFVTSNKTKSLVNPKIGNRTSVQIFYNNLIGWTQTNIMAISQTTAIAMSEAATKSISQKQPMEFEPKIWVLGGKSRNADMSIPWNAPFPNFADPDILIINLDTLDDRAVPGVVDKTKFQRAMVDINDKFMNGMGNIVLITSPRSSTDVQNKSQYDLSPVRFSTVPVQEGRNIKFDAG